MTNALTASSIALAFALLGANAANAANPDFMGRWTVTASQPAPWVQPNDKPVESDLKALMGKAVTFSAKRIDAPRPLACTKPHYEMRQYDPDMLFQGNLTAPEKQAAALGYGAKIATLETGCEGALDFHFINGDSAMFALNNRLYKMERNNRNRRHEAMSVRASTHAHLVKCVPQSCLRDLHYFPAARSASDPGPLPGVMSVGH